MLSVYILTQSLMNLVSNNVISSQIKLHNYRISPFVQEVIFNFKCSSQQLLRRERS